MNRVGGLEGLPLYMIILVTITAIALVAIIFLIPKPIVPSYMVIEPTELCWDTGSPERDPQGLNVTVYAKDDKPIADTSVHIFGANVDKTLKTAAGGRLETKVDPTTSNPNPTSTTLTIEATFGGQTITNSMPVNLC